MHYMCKQHCNYPHQDCECGHRQERGFISANCSFTSYGLLPRQGTCCASRDEHLVEIRCGCSKRGKAGLN
eukprot:3166755-Rhodomonas_salina.1